MTSIRSIFFFFVIIIFFIGPWPIDNTHFSLTKYANNTFKQIKQIKVSSNESQIYAGAAKVEITPVLNAPLAGYVARDSEESTGSLDKIYAKAITIANIGNKITLISAEILLPLPELVDAIVLKTGLDRNQIYFMATHTHSGPGGYAHGLIAEASIGKYSQRQFKLLVNTMSEAILKSRENLLPVKLTYSRLSLSASDTKRFIHNQLLDDAIAHNSIHTLKFTSTKSKTPLATLVSFSAHSTFLGRVNMQVSGDYPNTLTKSLENKLGGIVVFSSGAVGSMLPAKIGIKKTKDAKSQIEERNKMAESLASTIFHALSTTSTEHKLNKANLTTWQVKKTSIQSEVIPVNLPWPNYRVTDNLRLSPYLIQFLFHNNTTYIQTLKIGKLILLSYPADYSGELALDLENWGDDIGIYPWTMSFNGEYIGYIMPSKRYDLDHYTTRDVNFYGRWAGDYLYETSKKIILQLQSPTEKSRNVIKP